MRDIRDFLVANPHEVLVIVIEDYVTPGDTERAFRDSGLLDFVYRGPVGRPWPTPRTMIESGGRVLVMGEHDTGTIPWYHRAFDLAQETPFTFRSPAELSCRANRGPSTASLFLLNNWIDTSPAPRPSNAEKVNAYGALLGRARDCRERRGLLPNLVAVDFYATGDVLGVVDALNGFR